MGARKSYPNGFICNIIDKYTNGAEIMRSIQSDFRNGKMSDIVDLVEQAANLPSGYLNNPYHVQCFAASVSIPGEDEKRVGDLYKDNFKATPQNGL